MKGTAVSENATDDPFTSWKRREEIAEAMIPMIGRLYRERDVTILVHSRSLVNKSVISILKTHRFVRQIENAELSVLDSYPILEALTKLDLGPSRIDIGKLAVAYARDSKGLTAEQYTEQAVAGALGANKVQPGGTRDGVLYGCGRIGRILARLLIEKAGSGQGLRLRAVVVRRQGENDLVKRASLL